MKKYTLSIILILLIILTYIYKAVGNSIENKVVSQVNLESITNINNNQTQIYLYNTNISKTESILVNTKAREFMTYSEYVELIIENTKYLNSNMELLAVYELNENEILVKLNDQFDKLSEEKYKGLVISIKQTLSEAFPNLKTIAIQIDKNN